MAIDDEKRDDLAREAFHAWYSAAGSTVPPNWQHMSPATNKAWRAVVDRLLPPPVEEESEAEVIARIRHAYVREANETLGYSVSAPEWDQLAADEREMLVRAVEIELADDAEARDGYKPSEHEQAKRKERGKEMYERWCAGSDTVVVGWHFLTSGDKTRWIALANEEWTS